MTLDGAVETAARISARLGGAIILLSAILVALEVASRNLGLGIRFHAFDLTNYGFATAVAFGFAFALTQRAHIRIDILYQKVPTSAKAILDAISLCMLTILAFGMSLYAWQVVSHSMRLGARPNSTLDVHIAIPQAVWACGLTWFALVSLALSIQSLTALRKGGSTALHDRIGITLDAGADGK